MEAKMTDHLRPEQNNVVQLNPERAAGTPAPIVLVRLPAAMHSLRDKARQQLQGLLRDLFDKVDDAMFELADKATNNHDQNMYFDSMREVRLSRRNMEAAFFRSIDIRFAQLLDHKAYRDELSAESKEFSLEDLSLVKNDDLEEMVAIDSMINKANEQFAEAIQHLTLRIDHLVPIKVYQKNNPLGVDVICHAFNDAAKLIDIDVRAKLVLFKLFDNMVMTKLDGFFQSLNQLLIESNILPSLQQGRRAKRPTTSSSSPSEFYGAGLSAAIEDEEHAAPSRTSNSAGRHENNHAHASAYDEQTHHVLSTLRGLLGNRTETAAPQRSSGEEIATHELVDILSRAQQQHISASASAATASPINVREWLQDVLRNQEQKNQPINQVDDDVINLVSMMFEFILDDRNLAAPMKALIGRLQIPMVKVAIADKTFFSKGGHPARRLLNEMAMAALGWQESGEENQRRDSLYNKMESTVQAILADFENDLTIFDTLLTDFRVFLEKDKRRAQILEQRTIDAEDGKAKSERARAQVDTVLNRVMAGHELPDAAQKLLRDAWGNVLFITSLKQGVESAEWQSAVRTAQQLVWSLVAPMTKENRQSLLKLVPQLLQHLRTGLESISYSPFETTQLFKQLEALHLTRLRSVLPAVPAAPTAPENASDKKVGEVKVNEIKTSEIKASEIKIAEPTEKVIKPVQANPAPVVEKTERLEKVEAKGPVAGTVEKVEPIIAASKAQALVVDVVEQPKAIAKPVASQSDVAPEQMKSSPVVTAPATAKVNDSVVDTVPVEVVVTTPVEVAVIEPLITPTTTLDALDTFVVLNEELEADSAIEGEELADNDEHLLIVSSITQGSWFEMHGDDGQKFRCRLAAIIRATGKYIFVNRSGMKVAEETRMTLAMALKSGRLHILDDGMLFDRALEAVIGNLRASR